MKRLIDRISQAVQTAKVKTLSWGHSRLLLPVPVDFYISYSDLVTHVLAT